MQKQILERDSEKEFGPNRTVSEIALILQDQSLEEFENVVKPPLQDGQLLCPVLGNTIIERVAF